MSDDTGKHQIPDSSVAAQSRVAGHRKARRRLILAAGAALPSIWTLSSGAQTAAASNRLCWTHQSEPTPARFTPSSDTWYRAPVYVGDHNGTPAYCVSPRQSECADGATDSVRTNPPASLVGPQAGNAREGSAWIVNGTRVTAGPGTQITNVGRGPPQYALVYVDQTGTISTLDPTRAGNVNAVTFSCWASVGPEQGRMIPLG